jgi:hypothetical protein
VGMRRPESAAVVPPPEVDLGIRTRNVVAGSRRCTSGVVTP